MPGSSTASSTPNGRPSRRCSGASPRSAAPTSRTSASRSSWRIAGIIRHLGKLRAVRANAAAIVALRAAGQPIGAWLAAWPADDAVGLWDELARRFSQLGGNSGPYFLRMAGRDTFILSESVARGAGALAGGTGATAQPRGSARRSGSLHPLGGRERAASLPALSDSGALGRLSPLAIRQRAGDRRLASCDQR